MGCGKQIECVDLASRPGDAGGGRRWIGSAFALSLPMCDLTVGKLESHVILKTGFSYYAKHELDMKIIVMCCF